MADIHSSISQAAPMRHFFFKLLLCTCGLNFPLFAQESIELAHQTLIVDTHIDVPFRIYRTPETDVTKTTQSGQFDLPRASAGGLNAAFMSIYIPASFETKGGAKELADELIDLVDNIIAKAPDKLGLATCVNDVYEHQATGLISLPLGMENGAPIQGNLENLMHFRNRGIRYITLAHSKSNHISDSSYDTNEQWGGLSAFGKTLVSAMNDQGIMVDISHLSDNAAWQVLELSNTPVIASHSSLRHFVPGFHRNMTDDMVKALADNNGVIQINFGSSFVTAKARSWSNEMSAATLEFKEAQQLENTSPELAKFRKDWMEKRPYPFAGLSDILDHIDRVVELTSIDHVGIGSDFDGVGNTLPEDLKDASSYPNLIIGLRSRGYNDDDIAKIMGGNLMRVWSDVENFSRGKGFAPICSNG